MSRATMPSTAQLEKLMEYLERNRFLATGFARTFNARDRNRSAWQEIASSLNSEGGGCLKTWQQWAKYWKDKKSAIKKKYSQIQLARQRTGGGAAEVDKVLSPTEERILGLMGGRSFAVGDKDLEINPFHHATNVIEAQAVADAPTHSEGPNVMELIVQDHAASTHSTVSESMLQGYVQLMAVEPGTSGLSRTENKRMK